MTNRSPQNNGSCFLFQLEAGEDFFGVDSLRTSSYHSLSLPGKFNKGREMRKYAWSRIFLKALIRPGLFIQFLRLQRSYSDLDEWLRIDERKTEIVVKIIGCRNAESFKNQQRENMRYRKKFTDSFRVWLELVKRPEHQGAISAIADEYERKKLCHRRYRGKDAGARCYCA